MLVNYFFGSHLVFPFILFIYLYFNESFHSFVSGFQGNPVGQSGLGMAYLYGRGVQVVSFEASILT